MINRFHLKALTAAMGVGAAMLAAAPANAYVYATSHLEISNLSLVTTSGTAAVSGYTFNLTNTATLQGVSTIQTATCNSTANPCNNSSPVLDAAPANAPGSAPIRANNNFNFLGFGTGTSYSNSDSVITTAAVVQGVPTSTNQIAESLLNTNGNAAASTLVQSNTALTFSIVVGSGGANLALRFLADPDQMTQIAGLPGQYLAQSDMTASFTLNGGGANTPTFINWTPRGTAAFNDCIAIGATCSEFADSVTLQGNTSTATNPGSDNISFEAAQNLQSFGIDITGLAAGNYTLTLSAGTSTSITQSVIPEPGTTGLIGLALAGLALTTKRRFGSNKKA